MQSYSSVTGVIEMWIPIKKVIVLTSLSVVALSPGVGQAVAVSNMVLRKVRAPQGRVPGNAWAM